MHRSLLLLMLAAVFSATAYAQESAEEIADGTTEEIAAEPAQSTTETEAEAEPTESADEPVVVDDEYYQDVDDKDFRPSEDIPADQSIPYPTDI